MSKGYGQFCPLAKAAELLCERWTMILVRELVAGSRRFNDLRRGLPRISPTLLSRRLHQLAQAGVVQRLVDDDGTQSYELTCAGRELAPMVQFMGTWGHRWVGSHLEEQDLDMGLLMWDIRRGVDAGKFPRQRVVVQFELIEAPTGWADWWLVSENGEIDLCLEDPGYEVDLLVRCTPRTLTAVWLCRRSVADAEGARELQILGNSSLRKRFPEWLQGSPLARLGEASLRADPVLQELVAPNPIS
ncbi:MAG: winged helix-turn-helix transcriptional regulator [Thioalkalivibrio sp.]